MNEIIAIWIGIAVGAACVSPLVMDDLVDLADLPGEGRAVVGILAALVWPLLLVTGVLWLVCALGRGVAQVWRLLVPAKAKLPKAQVRR